MVNFGDGNICICTSRSKTRDYLVFYVKSFELQDSNNNESDKIDMDPILTRMLEQSTKGQDSEEELCNSWEILKYPSNLQLLDFFISSIPSNFKHLLIEI